LAKEMAPSREGSVTRSAGGHGVDRFAFNQGFAAGGGEVLVKVQLRVKMNGGGGGVEALGELRGIGDDEVLVEAAFFRDVFEVVAFAEGGGEAEDRWVIGRDEAWRFRVQQREVSLVHAVGDDEVFGTQEQVIVLYRVAGGSADCLSHSEAIGAPVNDKAVAESPAIPRPKEHNCRWRPCSRGRRLSRGCTI
jgi:hypothetical protein